MLYLPAVLGWKCGEDLRQRLCITLCISMVNFGEQQSGDDKPDIKTSGRFPAERMGHDDERAIGTLIARCLEGDQSAFAELYNMVAGGMYRLAYSILLDKQDAEDVVQESVVYAFRNLHRYSKERGAFRTWLYTITVSRCRNARRRKWLPTVNLASILATSHEPAAPEEHAPEHALVRQNTHDALNRALTALSPRLREAVALRYGQGLTYREMADILNVPQKTAESRVRLAHEALRDMLRESAYEADLFEEMLSY
jgi:RNA polymerase sigma-70 factor, ECF subfamily